MRRRVPNTDRLRETIGFAPGIPFEQTLRRIISHFELTLPAPVAPAVGEDVLPPRLHPEAALAAVG